MEVYPDFDTQEVARTVALAVSTLHNRNLSSDSCNDETPLVTEKSKTMDHQSSTSALYKDDRKDSQKSTCRENVTSWIPARYVLTLLGFLGFCCVYALRVNLSVAMVAMVNSTVYSSPNSTSNECQVAISTNETVVKEGEFIWSSKLQGVILGSFFYGYIVTQIPGGRMAEIFGGKWLFGLGVLCTAVFTLLTPVAARYHVSALIALRVLEGLGEGVTFPAMHCMLGKWLPKFERSLLSTIIYSGSQIGTVIAMPLSGVLCDSNFLGGWPSVFYVFGFLGCLWFIFWAWLIYETPEEHPRISRSELLLIQCDNKPEDKDAEKPSIPWKVILTSAPVWALIITHFGQNWGFYMLLTELPTYLHVILHFDIRSNGYLSALPYLFQAICSWITSYVADIIRKKGVFSISAIRKTCNSIGFFGPAICFVGVSLVGCNATWSVTFLTLALGFNGAIYSGYMVTHVDMSPTFAGTLMGMSNCFATLAGFLTPTVVGVLTDENQTLNQWRLVFYIAVAVYIVTGILFIVCGSARLQKWDISCLTEVSSTEKPINYKTGEKHSD